MPLKNDKNEDNEEIKQISLFFILNCGFNQDFSTKYMMVVSLEQSSFQCEIFNKKKYNQKAYAEKDYLKENILMIFNNLFV